MLVTIIRVGTRKGEITLEAAEAMKAADKVILHTQRCGCAEWLRDMNIPFASLDDIYEQAEDFDEHAKLASQAVLSCGLSSVCYCVLDLADKSVKALMHTDARIQVLGGGDADALLARAEGPVTMLCAMDMENAVIHSKQNTLVREIDSRMLASEVKLKLMEHYPEEMPVYVQKPDGGIAHCALADLDRLSAYDHRCACLVPAVTELTQLERYDFNDLMRLTACLRDPENGCPWDREQTHVSFKRTGIEEAYELEDAIDTENDEGIVEELGDMLFTVAMHIQIAEEHGEFDAGDVLTGIVKKMIFRHPHVFANEKAANSAEVLKLWDEVKKQEKELHSPIDEMRAVANGFPALLRARKVLKKAFSDREKALKALEHVDDGSIAYRLFQYANELREQGKDAESELQDMVKRFMAAYENA